MLLPNGDEVAFVFTNLGTTGHQTAYLTEVDYTPSGGSNNCRPSGPGA